MCVGFLIFSLIIRGIITDDAEWQLTQAIGLRSYSNHQPWIHTMIHRVFYQIGYSVFHTPNAGVASCVLGQMVIMAGSYAYLLMTFYKEKMGKRFLVGCLIYFALFPINALYAVTLWKDVLLGAVVLILSLSIWKMTRETCGVGNYIVFFLTGILLCILRSNRVLRLSFVCSVSDFLFKRETESGGSGLCCYNSIDSDL